MLKKQHRVLNLRLAGKFHEVATPSMRLRGDEFYTRTLLLQQYEALLQAFQEAVKQGDQEQVDWHLRSITRMSAGLQGANVPGRSGKPE